MENILLLTNKLLSSPQGGRELLCKLNHDVLKDICGDHLVVFELPQRPPQGFRGIAETLRGHIDGLSPEVIARILRRIEMGNINKVFIDGSNFGEFARVVKCTLPHVDVITFFHNVEARFFFGALRQSRTLRALAVLGTNYLAEKKAIRYSDKMICLTERDSKLLKKLYGRPASCVSSIALRDKRSVGTLAVEGTELEKFALFVGGTFYANRAGIEWFVEHVVPHINIATYVVGRGFENVRKELERDAKVKVIGAVDDLEEWYRRSHFVVAPIFDGSGMKTKVAEALMFGKNVIGTPEAFVGYDDSADRMGAVCSTAIEFIDAINRFASEQRVEFDTGLRALYEEKYSFSAARARLEKILDPAQ